MQTLKSFSIFLVNNLNQHANVIKQIIVWLGGRQELCGTTFDFDSYDYSFDGILEWWEIFIFLHGVSEGQVRKIDKIIELSNGHFVNYILILENKKGDSLVVPNGVPTIDKKIH